VLFGAGSAGCGIGKLLLELMVEDGFPELEARKRFFSVDRPGLLLAETPTPLQRRRYPASARIETFLIALAVPVPE